MAQNRQRDDDEADQDQEVHDSLPALVAAGHRPRDERSRCKRNGEERAHPEVLHSQAHTDELGDDGQEVEDEEVADREEAPELPKALEDQPGMADAGDQAEPYHHLLVYDQHGYQEKQVPEQRSAIVLARLGVGSDATGVVVADHDDQPGSHDGGEGK